MTVAGVAALVAGYGKIDRFMKLAEKYLPAKYGGDQRSGDDDN